MKKEEKMMDVVFLLDRSGSMRGIEDSTISGYNEYLEKFKYDNARITTVLFDDMYEMITERKNVKDVSKLNKKKYFVRGCTALLDAIGKSITYMEKEKAKKVIFIITTDGYENASKEYKKEQIKEMIEGHKEWEFIYIGADIDSYAEGASIGIRTSNIANYKKANNGIDKMFSAVFLACKSYSEDECISEDWKEGLE